MPKFTTGNKTEKYLSFVKEQLCCLQNQIDDIEGGDVTSSGESAGQVAFFTGAGTLTGDSDMTFATNTLTVTVLKTDTVNEKTAASGVTIDGALIKDSGITISYFKAGQKTITNADSAYTVLDSDYSIFCDASGGDIDINLPSAAVNAGRILNVKKIDSSGGRVRLTPDGGDLIDGNSPNDNTTPYNSITIQSDGVNWWII